MRLFVFFGDDRSSGDQIDREEDYHQKKSSQCPTHCVHTSFRRVVVDEMCYYERDYQTYNCSHFIVLFLLYKKTVRLFPIHHHIWNDYFYPTEIEYERVRKINELFKSQ